MFIFSRWEYDEEGVASFHYKYQDYEYVEKVAFDRGATEYDKDILDRALFLAFILIGTSYYKCFPVRDVRIESGKLDEWQAAFFTKVYQEGLSQFAYENNLTREQLPTFLATDSRMETNRETGGEGDIVMQSGGKDSLLLATLLQERGKQFTPWYVSSSNGHPAVLDTFETDVIQCERSLDKAMLARAREGGARNGHVPVTYILLSLALVQAVLLGKRRVLTAIGHEGEEPHATVGDLAITHQWSKTYEAEQNLSQYVRRYIASDLEIFSPLRRYSELQIAELFVEKAWSRYGHSFSSCNLANYQQGHINEHLTWCGRCPKCANSFLLFAPFVPRRELTGLFNGEDLSTVPELELTFKGLLGVEGVMKPFECVGETAELRLAYHMAQATGEYAQLTFEVPSSDFDYKHEYESGGDL